MIRPKLNEYSIAKGVRAFSSTRQGGVSKGVFGAFNINEFCGDNPDDIVRNRLLLATELGITPDHIIMPHQVHEAKGIVIDNTWRHLTAEERRQKTEGYDAIMTRERSLCIGVSTADCIPVLLYDAKHDAIAAVHAGWRGTVKRILEHTIQHMQQVFATQPADLHAVIGPGISCDAFEVGDEVYETFRAAGFDMSAISCHKDKWHIDLKACNCLQLLHAGLQNKNIQATNVCTYTRFEDYFSARRLGLNSGRIFTGIMLQA